MKKIVLWLVLLLLISNRGLSQVVEEVSFWKTRIIGLEVRELIISFSAVIFLVFIAYRMSVNSKNK